jgi:hypothetical protein
VEPASPRLADVRSRLNRGDQQAVADLWRELRERGTPLVENSDQSDELLITLLAEQTDAGPLSVVGGLSGLDPTDTRMRRLRGSRLWYRTYRAPANLRTVYAFAPSKAPDDPTRWTADPLNPLAFVYPAPRSLRGRIRLREEPRLVIPQDLAGDPLSGFHATVEVALEVLGSVLPTEMNLPSPLLFDA